MNKILILKKIGNHWYPNINHGFGEDISLTRNIEHYLNLIFKDTDIVHIGFEEYNIIFDEYGILYLNEQDITRFYTTDDEFNIRFELYNINLSINATLFMYIQNQLGLRFHEDIYKIHIW